ncbi:hypothetical protein BDQ17DRAFT_1368221 [Cyathus striatus]|nr:hypothetical protein BDQ17DRAFT_1368221 [Cyathus striatus]
MEHLSVLIDDSDLNALQYQCNGGHSCWGIYHSYDSDKQFKNTSHFTETVGASAQFNFTGISVAVYGTVASSSTTEKTVVSFNVDGILSPVISWLSTATFPISTLKPGNHTLTSSLTGEGGWLSVDYVEYIPIHRDYYSFGSLTRRSSDQSPSNSRISTGSIIGITIGIVIVLLGAIYLALHQYRRKSWVRIRKNALDPLVVPIPSPPIHRVPHVLPSDNVDRAHQVLKSLSPGHADLPLHVSNGNGLRLEKRDPRVFYHHHADSFSSLNGSASNIPLLQYPLPVKSRTDIHKSSYE